MVASVCASLLGSASAGASGTSVSPTGSTESTAALAATTGIHKIKHVIVIMQENRSFDDYFGTYPGADGIPATNGQFTVCNPDPIAKTCDKPYHNPSDTDLGGCHGGACISVIEDGGKMDGFVTSAEQFSYPTDVMGYQDARDIPNYWAYAQNFVLNDHMFMSTTGWSLPQHLYMVSAWSALCSTAQASSCVNNIEGPYSPNVEEQQVNQALSTGTSTDHHSWTDITYLLYKKSVSWRYYIETGTTPDCVDGNVATCPSNPQSYKTPGIWNPLPLFSDVQQDNQISNVKPLDSYFTAAAAGTLPAVSWISPSGPNSEHPQIGGIHEGQAYVTNLINAAMSGPDWNSTAIFLSWDDWGGFYDNVMPPTVDKNGFGPRVPSLVISAYAKKGYIDHQTLSQDAYLKFIEDDFLGGSRLDPKTDGRPDPRPDVRENQPALGNMVSDFNFSQTPRPPVLLPLNPAPGPASTPGG